MADGNGTAAHWESEFDEASKILIPSGSSLNLTMPGKWQLVQERQFIGIYAERREELDEEEQPRSTPDGHRALTR